jgi:hypothetical protein
MVAKSFVMPFDKIIKQEFKLFLKELKSLPN